MIERRYRNDRRQHDLGPPSQCVERRKRAERRLARADELDLAPEDFARLFGNVAKFGNADGQMDLAAQVFDRINDR